MKDGSHDIVQGGKMAGFSGAVEDGARGIGTVLSLVAAVIVGWVFGSFAVGFGVFLAGYVAAHIWGHVAGENFRARMFQDVERDRGEDPSAHGE